MTSILPEPRILSLFIVLIFVPETSLSCFFYILVSNVFTEEFKVGDFVEKGLKANGVRLANKEVDSVTVEAANPELFKTE